MLVLLCQINICLLEKGIHRQVEVFVDRVDILCLFTLCCVAGVFMLQ